MNINTALTIAGSDSSGGAGIQADLKTFCSTGIYGMSVITSVTSQNTTGVFDVFDIPAKNVKSQIKAVFEDIFPDAIKIGMVSSSEIINAIADSLSEYNPSNIVLDTVMVSTSGHRLISEEAVSTLSKRLFPLSDIITPNIPEAQILSGLNISNKNDMEHAAKFIFEKYGTSVLLKGGHSINDSNDYLFSEHGGQWFSSERINNTNTHGTGCTLSSAIASYLAQGMNLNDAVLNAKHYISRALYANLNLGKGSGPLMHNFNLFNF